MKASLDGKTLISKHRKETARNKPMVNYRIYEKVCPVLFDMGAEINVIDELFLRKLMQLNKTLAKPPKKGARLLRGQNSLDDLKT